MPNRTGIAAAIRRLLSRAAGDSSDDARTVTDRTQPDVNGPAGAGGQDGSGGHRAR